MQIHPYVRSALRFTVVHLAICVWGGFFFLTKISPAYVDDEHRIQVDTNEFWLVSPSENLVRVEIVENAQRRQQLQALVESPPPPAPNQGDVNSPAEQKK